MLSTFRTGRRVALSAGVLVGATALTVGLAVPASAVTIFDWVTGYVPSGSGCTITSLSGTPAGDVALSYTDSVTPSVAGWSLNGKTSVALLVPGTNNLKFAARVKQSCGGVSDGAQLALKYVTTGFGSSVAPIPVTTPTTANPFDQTFTYTFPGSVGYAGWYQVPLWQAEIFDHVIRSEESLDEKWQYVCRNPERAGLVGRWEEWPHQGSLTEWTRGIAP